MMAGPSCRTSNAKATAPFRPVLTLTVWLPRANSRESWPSSTTTGSSLSIATRPSVGSRSFRASIGTSGNATGSLLPRARSIVLLNVW